jgi:hypothetical protein
MRRTLIILFSTVLFLTACGNNRKSKNGITPANDEFFDTMTGTSVKPIVNVYIENSSSMDGYVKGVTEFEQAVYNYLTDIKISKFTDSLNLNYINSDIIPQGSDIEDFIEKLEPDNFRVRGGNRGTSDISNILKSVLSETQENEVAILVTDGIFSPGKGKDAAQYLVNQQIGIKNSMAEYLKLYPNTAVILYRLSSKFDGYYYNREDSRTYLRSQRPFFIWLIGPIEQLSNLRTAVSESKFKGSGVQNTFSITTGNKEINYAVKLGSGKFKLDMKSPKNAIKNLKKDTKGKHKSARFSVNADLSGFLLNDDYLNDNSNYDISSKDFIVTVSKAVSPFTHQLNLSSDNVHKGIVSIKLKTQIPPWVEAINDNDGSVPLEGKTYGIKYQIEGIYEAFTFSNDFYTELKIYIN